MVPEGRRVFGELSVRQNLLLGATVRRRDTTVADDVDLWCARFGVLGARLDRPAGELSGGEQQMLVIARALMSRPQLLLLDEPSLGLAPKVVDEIFGILRELHGAGMTILLVEQAARRAVSVADRSYILRGGRIHATGTAEQLAGSGLAEAYFGAA